MRYLLLVAVLAACVESSPDFADLPTCRALGCPVAPSGDPEIWIPCPHVGVCYCRTGDAGAAEPCNHAHLSSRNE